MVTYEGTPVHISMIFTMSKSHDFTQSCQTWQEMKLKIRFIIFVYSIKSCNHMLLVFIKREAQCT
jgi:hypothetical protein